MRLARRAIAGAVSFAVAFGCLVAAAPPNDSATPRFVIEHAAGTSAAYVELVRNGLDAAYELFVTHGLFPTFDRAVVVRILDGDMDGMGAEYLDEDEEGNPIPIIEIASREAMSDAADEMLVSVSLDDAVLSTTAHEFFHVLQDYAALHGQGDIEEPAFVEPLATAIQELAAPNADDYLDAAIDFLRAPDDAPFFSRGYDAGIFWVFVLERYGLDAIRRVMAASAAADGARAIDLAFAGDGLAFLDVWAKFAAAWATGTLPDAAARAELAHAWRRETGLAGLDRPPVIAVARWDGRPLVVDHATEDEYAAPLRLSYPYGIDAVSIHVESQDPLAVAIDAATAVDLRVIVVGRRDGAFDLLSLSSGRQVVITQPDRYAEILVVLTRGEVGSGAYAVRLAPAT